MGQRQERAVGLRAGTPRFWPTPSPIGLDGLGLSFSICGMEEPDHVNLGPSQLWRFRNRGRQSLSHAANPLAKENQGLPAVPFRAQSLAGWLHLASLGRRTPQAAPSSWRRAGDYSSAPPDGSSVSFPGIGAGPGWLLSCPRRGCRGQQTCFLKPACRTPGSCRRACFLVTFHKWGQPRIRGASLKMNVCPLFLDISSLLIPIPLAVKAPPTPAPSTSSLPTPSLPTPCVAPLPLAVLHTCPPPACPPAGNCYSSCLPSSVLPGDVPGF